jgi:hypothetical protein
VIQAASGVGGWGMGDAARVWAINSNSIRNLPCRCIDQEVDREIPVLGDQVMLPMIFLAINIYLIFR